MIKIKELEEGMHLEQPLLVADVKNGSTDKGALYLSLTLQDSTGSIDAKFWNVKKEVQDIVVAGKIVNFKFDVILYQKHLQLRISKASEMDMSQVNYSDYVIASSVSEDSRRTQVQDMLSRFTNENYRKLTEGLLAKTGEAYFSYPAAAKIHHNFLGGLSEHSLSIAQLAETMCEHYPQLNRDLLVAGALVHDIGKTVEMSGPVTTEYTLEGKLEGHISIANGWLTSVETELGLQGTEEAILLHHMILSHHGRHEFGSPVLPALQEAEMLSMLDNIDARMNTLKQALNGIQPGNWTGRMFALDNRQFYKPKNS